jgi:hypothetical protein
MNTKNFTFIFTFFLLVFVIGCTGDKSSEGTTSNNAAITAAPVLKTQPANQTLPAVNTAVFSVEAENAAGVTYQWQQSPDGTAWTSISGAMSPSYQILAQTANTDNWKQFRCVLTNKIGSTNSNSAVLTVVTVLHVKYSTIANADGTSWATAYPSLQSALISTTCMAGTEIWLLPEHTNQKAAVRTPLS